MSDQERIEAIQQRVDEASGARWSWEDDSHGDCRKATLYSGRTPYAHGMNLLGRLEPDMNGHANLEFIAHAREDVPWLLSRLAEARQERDAAVADAELSAGYRRAAWDVAQNHINRHAVALKDIEHLQADLAACRTNKEQEQP